MQKPKLTPLESKCNEDETFQHIELEYLFGLWVHKYAFG